MSFRLTGIADSQRSLLVFASLISLLSGTAGSWLVGLFNLGCLFGSGLCDLGLLGLVSLLLKDLFLLAFLDVFSSNFSVLVTLFTSLSLSTLNFIERQTNDGLLDTSGFASSLLQDFVDLYLLVEGSPCERPC